MRIELERLVEPGGIVLLRLKSGGPSEPVRPGIARSSGGGGGGGKGGLDLDLLACLSLEDAIAREDAAGTDRLVIDLAGAVHLHSRGLWSIVDAARRRAGRGGVVLVGLSPAVAKVIARTSAADSVRVAASANDAVGLLGPVSP